MGARRAVRAAARRPVCVAARRHPSRGRPSRRSQHGRSPAANTWRSDPSRGTSPATKDNQGQSSRTHERDFVKGARLGSSAKRGRRVPSASCVGPCAVWGAWWGRAPCGARGGAVRRVGRVVGPVCSKPA
eukprot:7388775-Prymnesium_polylepis.1